jgi:sigma-B regulation protein RsbU (phosphoserine phosphatase)
LGEILTLTNRRLSESQLGDHFVTLLAVRFDPRKRALVFAGAGHCPGYVIDSWGRVKAVLRSGSLPLSVDVGEVIAVGADITLAPGDVVFLYTDGITEAASPEGEFFGTERALDVVRNQCGRTAEEVVASLCQAVHDFIRRQPQHDDMTAVVVKVEATPPVVVSCSSEGDCEIETPGCTSG